MENKLIIDYYRAMEIIRQKAVNTLRKSEKHFKTDMVYLAKGSFWLTLGQGISIVVGFGTSIIFANHILPNVYGTYKYLLSVVGLLGVTTLTGMGPMISQAVARGFEGSFYKALKTKIQWGFFGGFASLGLSAYYLYNANTQLALAFFVAAFFLPFMDSFQLYQDYLQGKKDFETSTKYASSSQIIAAIAMVCTVLLTKNLYAIILAYFASWTFSRLFFLTLSLRKYPPNKEVDPQTIPYAKNSSIIDLFASLVGSLDQILIFHYIGAIELAIYSFAIAPITQLVSPFKNLPVLAMPKLAARPVQEINSMLKKRILFAFLIGGSVVCVYYFFVPFFYTIFFPKYISSINLSRLYALTMLFSIPNTVIGPAVTSKTTSIPKKLLWLWNIPSILSTTFIFFTIQKIGVESVAFGRIILVISSLVISYYMWRYIVRTDKALTITSSDTNPLYPKHSDQA